MQATLLAPALAFATQDEIVHSHQTVAENPYVRRHIQSYYGGILEAEAHAMMARFTPTLLRRVTTGH